jgi:hypothetical protein
MIYVPTSLSQEVGAALGTQAGEAKLCSPFRRPFKRPLIQPIVHQGRLRGIEFAHRPKW